MVWQFKGKEKVEVPTNSARRSQAEENHIAALGVMQQLDELMQHDGDGGDAHAVLQYINIYDVYKRSHLDKEMQDILRLALRLFYLH